MELKLLDKVRKLIGWESGDGAFAPGGAHCNLLAILAARNFRAQGVRKVSKLLLFWSVLLGVNVVVLYLLLLCKVCYYFILFLL